MSLRYSIIVPVYNNPADLRNCIESLKALDYPAEDYEIIVVDNNSTDDTAAVATELGVTCLSETRFQSSYAARNTGIKAARGTFIAFTDSDCVADRGWLKAIDAVCGDEGAGCFAGEILSVEPTTTVERFSDRIGLLRQKGPPSGWHFKPYAQTANAVYRKSVFDQIGLFDPATNSGGDAAIAWRMLDKTTYTIRFVPEAIVYHHHRTSVPDLYAQFRRYGGGKMSWALSQNDYQPPAIAKLEKDVVEVFAKHLETLESHGVDDEVLFSGLKAATQAAQLSGYLQELLRYTTNGAALEKAPAIARERAPTCNICGSHSFIPGPSERLANGRPPQCRECGSLERHRVVHTLIQNLGRNLLPKLTCVSIDEPLLRGKSPFKHHATLPRAGLRSSQGTAKYDIVLARSTFAGLDEQGFADALEELAAILHEDSLLMLVDGRYENSSEKIRPMLTKLLPNAASRYEQLIDKNTATIFDITVIAATGNSVMNYF